MNQKSRKVQLETFSEQGRVNHLQKLSAESRRFQTLPWIVLFIFLAITSIAVQFSKRTIDRGAKEYFQYKTADATDSILSRLHLYGESLKGVRSLFNAEGEVNRAQFRDYVSGLHLRHSYPGIQGVGFSLIIPPAKLQEHIQSIRGQGFPQYLVKPEGKRDLYTAEFLRLNLTRVLHRILTHPKSIS